MKAIRIILLILLIILVGIQLIPSGMPDNQPEDENSITNSDLLNQEVSTVLKTSCFDCHSNQTNFPWYSKIAPASWLLADHIREGKSHVNFSEWEKYKKREKIGILDEIQDEVEAGTMPLKSYLLIHRDAVLDENEVKLITAWTEKASAGLME